MAKRERRDRGRHRVREPALLPRGHADLRPGGVPTAGRRRAALVFKRVTAVRSIGLDRKADDEVSNMLSVTFEKTGDGPEGSLVITLSGGGEIVADVECIEVLLADLSASWEARGKPHHPR